MWVTFALMQGICRSSAPGRVTPLPTVRNTLIVQRQPMTSSSSISTRIVERLFFIEVVITAIPWQPLRTISRTGPGVFKDVSYVQRVNTAGGLARITPGTSVGEESRVAYTAEYFFYRSNADRYRQANLVPDLPGAASRRDGDRMRSASQ